MNKTRAEQLRDLKQRGILATDTLETGDVEPTCAMFEDCYCPKGSKYFSQKEHPPRDWDPSADHFPRLRKNDGKLTPGNVRLMHIHCNRVDYAKLALEERLLSLTDDTGAPLDRRAVARAMEYHLGLLAENNGRVAKSHKSWASASRVAIEQHEALRTEPASTSLQDITPLFDRWRQSSASAFNDGSIGASPAKDPSSWERFVEWEKTLPERFDPDKSSVGSDYNLHHSIVEATAEEINDLLSRGSASTDHPAEST